MYQWPGKRELHWLTPAGAAPGGCVDQHCLGWFVAPTRVSWNRPTLSRAAGIVACVWNNGGHRKGVPILDPEASAPQRLEAKSMHDGRGARLSRRAKRATGARHFGPTLRGIRRLVVLIAATLILPKAVYAGSAEQFAGLFIQGCLPFAGNPSGLREWARRTGLPLVPEPADKAFLHGAPGQTFDGSAAEAKLVLVSSDDGICSVVTNQAMQQQVIQALEAGLRQAGLAFRLVIERDDAHIPAIHDREYLAARDKRAWRILAGTVKDEQGGEAMLTAAVE